MNAATRGMARVPAARALTACWGRFDERANTSFKGVVFGLWGVVARPSFSKHEEAWEKLRQVPVGTFRRYAELEGGAIQSVLDGEIGTTEGGARLLQELHDDGVVGTEAMSPMDLTHQLRKILEAGRVDPLLHQVLRRLRYDGLHTGLVCHQWSHAGKSISTPELVRAKANLQRHFNVIVECKEEKLNRLDPSLYTLAAKRIAAQPQELIYIDCREHHLEPAAAVGMTTLHLVSPQATVTALEGILQMQLRTPVETADGETIEAHGSAQRALRAEPVPRGAFAFS